MKEREKTFFGFGASTATAAAQETLRLVDQADRDGLDLFTVSDHPYVGDRLDAYAILSLALGRTANITGAVNVTNLPTRPAPMLARAITSLSALSNGRVVLGLGAGGSWDDIGRLGVERLSPGAAVRAFEEAIGLIRALSGAGTPVTFAGEFYQVTELEPAPVPPVPVWTGSVGPQTLAVTGRLADGWFPGRAADWLSERYRTSRAVIDEAATAVGRDPREVATIYNLPGVITAAPLTSPRNRDGRWQGGSVGQWVEELTTAVLEHNASGFVYFPVGATPTEVAIARWAQEIVPAVREVIAAKSGPTTDEWQQHSERRSGATAFIRQSSGAGPFSSITRMSAACIRVAVRPLTNEDNPALPGRRRASTPRASSGTPTTAIRTPARIASAARMSGSRYGPSPRTATTSRGTRSSSTGNRAIRQPSDSASRRTTATSASACSVSPWLGLSGRTRPTSMTIVSPASD